MKKFAFLSLAALALAPVAVFADQTAADLVKTEVVEEYVNNDSEVNIKSTAEFSDLAKGEGRYKGTNEEFFNNPRVELPGTGNERTGRLDVEISNKAQEAGQFVDTNSTLAPKWDSLDVKAPNVFVSADDASAFASRNANGRTAEIKSVLYKGLQFYYVVFGAKPAANEADASKATDKKEAKKVEAAKTATSGSGKALPKTSAVK